MPVADDHDPPDRRPEEDSRRDAPLDGEPFDFFVSVNSADRLWGEWIAWNLEAAGHTTFLYFWDIRPGDDFMDRMRRALAEARRFMPVLSASYFEGDYSQQELNHALAKDPLGEKRYIVGVQVRACELPDLLQARIHIDLTAAEDDAEALKLLLSGVVEERDKPHQAPAYPGTIRDIAGTSRQLVLSDPPPFPGALPAIWNVPRYRNPNFAGRDDVLEKIYDALLGGDAAAVTQPAAIHGLGGVGKTQVSTEFAYRYADKYNIVWWIRCDREKSARSSTSLVADMAALAELLRLKQAGGQDLPAIAEAVRRHLEGRDDWLLIFDNVVDPADVRDYLPRNSAGHVLITSRDRNWGNLAKTVHVDKWPRSESIRFLMNRTGDRDEQAAGELAELLDGLPLALEQAAVYIEETSPTTLREYIELYQQHSSDLLARGLDSNEYPASAATTWDISLQQVELLREGPAAIELLHLCAFFAPDALPLEILTEWAEKLPKSLREAAASPLRWKDVLASVQRYALAEVRGETAPLLFMHRVVQAVIRDSLEDKRRHACAATAVEIAYAAFPDFQNYKTWDACDALLEHALATAKHAEREPVAAETVSRLLDDAGGYLRVSGQYTQAGKLRRRAVAMAESTLEPNDPTLAVRYSNLAGVEKDLGNLEEARRLLHSAIEIDEAAYEPDHPALAVSYSNMAGVEQYLGNLEEARRLLHRAIKIDEAAYESDHPALAVRYSNLAGVEQDLGNLEEARHLLNKTIEIEQAAYESDHPTLAVSYSNLALVEQDLGNLDAARELMRRAYGIVLAKLGPEHPHTRDSAAWLEKHDPEFHPGE